MEEVQKFTGMFSKVKATLLELNGMNMNAEWLVKMERQMNERLQCYCKIYEEKNLRSKPQ